MTDDLEAKCREICPHCKAGSEVRLRPDTGEWVHDYSFAVSNDTKVRNIGHSVCLAHDLRSAGQ